RLRAMGRSREGPRAQARSYNSGVAWVAVFMLINAADCGASRITALSRWQKAHTQRDSSEL
ncbi:hypothetical protein, partial [Xanthomonas campestris]|uniref:hypothetical protein n=2 Tax=Xanthomonas campestris TaxID=339 RepID=UPI002B222C89